MGGRFGGYGLYLLKGKPVFTYNFLDLEWAVPLSDCISPRSDNSLPAIGDGGVTNSVIAHHLAVGPRWKAHTSAETGWPAP